MVFDQLRISGNCSKRCLQFMGNICREILPYFCCHQDIFMLFTNRIYKWHKFFVYRFFYGIFHVFSKPFNRMQQLFGQKMCQDNTDGNNQYQYQHHKWGCRKEHTVDTACLCCHTDNRSIFQTERIIVIVHLHGIRPPDTFSLPLKQRLLYFRAVFVVWKL